MPLLETIYGKECPLSVWEIDIPAGGGCYTSDPLEGCLGNPEHDICPCNYIRFPKEGEEFNPAVQCMCPVNITLSESRKLREGYVTLVKEGKADNTKEGFWKFVEENHR